MQLTWYGHSCFLLTAESGYSILTDPCDQETGYELHDLACDAVTISHEHHDHNCLAIIAGTPTILRTSGEHLAGEIPVTGFTSYHDDAKGAYRGENIVFLYQIDGLKVLHLGDLGHMLSDETIKEIGDVDVLLAPIGGVYTLNAKGATELSDRLHAKVLIPMHYKTPALHFNIEGLEPLLALSANRRVHHLNANTAQLMHDTLGERRLLILDYKR
ncbi:MAG: MBL fold metallo-hydrolase [Eubacteriales bacterium]|jgi:L-ascorbate metabolism protein UlaG (beta-lactamase superfamily)|nr:MBL fold metallo-hydrolase [Eubacteriales bacterium]